MTHTVVVWQLNCFGFLQFKKLRTIFQTLYKTKKAELPTENRWPECAKNPTRWIATLTSLET